ncbi:MAG: cytochrome c [Alphaproteobacteria bacterium]|nr:cytochrome c [Alphaproteobacteria bacterium]
MSPRRSWLATGIVVLVLAPAGCDDMANQPKRLPFELPLGVQAGWPAQPPAGVVARDEQPPPAPPPLTMAMLHRGQERFDIYCAPCHSRTGEGNGMIVQRGFPNPPSYFIERLRQAPIQHFYDVITNGYGVMFSYAQRVAPQDRWAIVAYIRALQASTDATLADVPADQRSALQ